MTGNKDLAKFANDFERLSQPIISFSETFELFGKGKASTLALANSALGVGLALSSVFGDSSNASAKQFASLQEELAKFRKEVREQFRQVNEKLDALLRASTETLRLLAENKMKVEDVRLKLTKQADQLDDLRREIDDIARRISEREIKSAHFRCLERKKRFNNIEVDRFQECLTDFVFVATAESFDPSFTNGDPRKAISSKTAIAHELEGAAPSEFPFLAAYLRALGNEDLTDEALPNPFIWAGGVDAYVQLVLQWADHPDLGRPPSVDLEKMEQQGMSLISAERALLGSTRPRRITYAKDIFINDLKSSSAKVQERLKAAYNEARLHIVRDTGSDDSFDRNLRPCKDARTEFERVMPLEHGLPSYQLEEGVLRRIHRAYLTRASNLLPPIEICYSKARFGAPYGYSGDLMTATPYVTIDFRLPVEQTVGFPSRIRMCEILQQCSVIGNSLIFRRREVGGKVQLPAGSFDRETTSIRGAQWRAGLSDAVIEALAEPAEAYLDEAFSKFDQDGHHRIGAWMIVAAEKSDEDLEERLAALSASRRLIELSLAFGAPESLRIHPQLADLTSSFSSTRIPDKRLVKSAFACLRQSVDCDIDGALTMSVLTKKRGVETLFEKRVAEFESLMMEVASNDPLDQADPNTAFALVRLRAIHKPNNSHAAVSPPN